MDKGVQEDAKRKETPKLGRERGESRVSHTGRARSDGSSMGDRGQGHSPRGVCVSGGVTAVPVPRRGDTAPVRETQKQSQHLEMFIDN